MKKAKEILNQFKHYNLEGFSHTNEGLISHLLGTYSILKSWNCSDDLCIAGLCHSIYGTESYRKNPIKVSERENIRKIIGKNSEKFTYYFGAHVKDSLWENLDRKNNFRIFDRLEKKEIELSEKEVQGLVTLTLANWLEQRPRASKEYQYLRKNEFLKSKDYLPSVAFDEFRIAYEI